MSTPVQEMALAAAKPVEEWSDHDFGVTLTGFAYLAGRPEIAYDRAALAALAVCIGSWAAEVGASMPEKFAPPGKWRVFVQRFARSCEEHGV